MSEVPHVTIHGPTTNFGQSCQRFVRLDSKQTETYEATSGYAVTPAQHSILSVPVLAKTTVSLFADTEGHLIPATVCFSAASVCPFYFPPSF